MTTTGQQAPTATHLPRVSHPVLAIDLGGTKTGLAVAEADGSLHEPCRIPTRARDGAEVILADVVAAAREVIGRYEFADERMGRGAVGAVGIGSAGVVSAEDGSILSATEAILGWAGTPLASHLSEALDLPVRALNDVHAHALGEARFGAGRGAHSMLLVAVGTGVGGGVVVDGEVLTGAHAVGGHIGHMTAADAAAVPCTCGGVGHLEAIASGPAVLAAYLRERADGADVARAPADTREVVRRADAGDRLARHVLETAGRAAGSTIGSLVAALDPEVVVLSGGMAQAGPIWRDALDRGFAQAVMPVLSDVPLREAAAGESAALLGAAAYAWGAIGPESGPEPDATPSDPEETP